MGKLSGHFERGQGQVRCRLRGSGHGSRSHDGRPDDRVEAQWGQGMPSPFDRGRPHSGSGTLSRPALVSTALPPGTQSLDRRFAQHCPAIAEILEPPDSLYKCHLPAIAATEIRQVPHGPIRSGEHSQHSNSRQHAHMWLPSGSQSQIRFCSRSPAPARFAVTAVHPRKCLPPVFAGRQDMWVSSPNCALRNGCRSQCAPGQRMPPPG